MKKVNVDPNSIKLLALPFPAMRSALNNGQVDAIWTPEPFLTQALTIDGARIVMAPGPVLGRFWPNGGYVSRDDWAEREPGPRQQVPHGDQQVARLRPDAPGGDPRPAAGSAPGTCGCRSGARSLDREQLLQLAKYAKEFGVISTLPNMTKLFPSTITGGKALQGAVGDNFILLRLDGKPVTR